MRTTTGALFATSSEWQRKFIRLGKKSIGFARGMFYDFKLFHFITIYWSQLGFDDQFYMQIIFTVS